MKKKIKNSVVYLIFAGFVLTCFIYCSNNQEIKQNSIAVNKGDNAGFPELLDRKDAVGNANEIDRMNEAYQKLAAKIKADPKDYDAKLKMADLYIVEARATGNYGYYYDAALNMINNVLDKQPKNQDIKFRALTSKAVILLSLHKFEEALKMGKEAVAINPHNARIYGVLTDAYVELGKYDEAVKMADKMVSIRPDLRSYSRISYLRELHGEVEGAIKAMKLAVSAGFPGYEETAWARVTLGKLYENYGDLANAEVQYSLALEERPHYPFALSGLARIKLKNKNYEEAEKLLKQAISIRPEAEFYEDLAILYNATGRAEKSDDMVQKAMQAMNALSENGADEEKPHTHNPDDKEEHSHGHEKNTNTHGHSHETGLEKAILYATFTDKYDEALHHATHELQKRPHNIDVNKTLAKIYYYKGDYDMAEAHLQKAMKTGINDPEIYQIGGLIKLKTGNAKEGHAWIQKSFEANPYQVGKLAEEAKAVLKKS